jgi:hypothetical protein
MRGVAQGPVGEDTQAEGRDGGGGGGGVTRGRTGRADEKIRRRMNNRTN